MSVIEAEIANQNLLPPPVRPPINGTVFTPKKKKRFLQTLADTGGNITRACELARTTKPTVYAHRARDPEFLRLWDEALEAGTEDLEQEARRRAMGYDETVYFQGQRCGVVTRYSDILTIFLLKGLKPDKYRDNVKIEAELSPQSVEAIGNSLAQALIKAAEARRMQEAERLTDGTV